jgi:hypothetical protein
MIYNRFLWINSPGGSVDAAELWMTSATHRHSDHRNGSGRVLWVFTAVFAATTQGGKT